MLTLFAVGKSVLQVEGTVGKDLVAVGAGKALGMKVGPHGFQAVLNRKVLDCCSQDCS